jgi:cell division protein FtsZ
MIRFELAETRDRNAKMRVIGIGGGGNNAVDRMVEEDLPGVEFVGVNTDVQALGNCRAQVKVQIGKKLTRGLGAGARPEIGRQAIDENKEDIIQVLRGADLVFVTAGLGGGTGTGAAPIVGQLARELGALSIAIVTKPFEFEGKKRLQQAEIGLAEIRKAVDTVIVVPNQRLLAVVGKGTSFREALKRADEVLLQATRGISDLISVTGDVNVDFADVRTVMANRGPALMGTGSGRGDNRAQEAAQEAISSPLLDDISISGAKAVLINITGGTDLTIEEVSTVSSMIRDTAGDEAEIIFGTVHDPTVEDEIRVTVIATGFEPDGNGSPKVLRPNFGARKVRNGGTRAAANTEGRAPNAPMNQNKVVPIEVTDPRELEIPTFIRRQMD